MWGMGFGRKEILKGALTSFCLLYLTVMPSLGEKRPVWGLNTHDLNGEIAADLQACGIITARVDFNWQDIEPEKGSFNWTRTDMMVKAAENYGIELLPVLCHAPAWAKRSGSNWPRDPAEYGEFARAVVERYKGKVHAWEIWNEPNYVPAWGANVDDYYALLKAAWSSIKAVDHTSTIVGGSGADLDFVEQLFLRGGAQYMDVLSIHPYSRPYPPEAEGVQYISVGPLEQVIKDYRDLAKAYGINRIWLTELGWPTATSWNSVTEAEQAYFLLRSALISIGSGAERYYWYQLGSGDSLTDPESQYGILRGNRTPKPAYVAYKTLSSLIGDGLVEKVSTPDNKTWGYQYRGMSGQKGWVFWTVEGSQEIRLANLNATEIEVITGLGVRERRRPAHGELVISASVWPLFIEEIPDTPVMEAGDIFLRVSPATAYKSRGEGFKVFIKGTPQQVHIQAAIYNLAGRLVYRFAPVALEITSTEQEVPVWHWAGSDLAGKSVPRGFYLYRFAVLEEEKDKGRSFVRKILIF